MVEFTSLMMAVCSIAGLDELKMKLHPTRELLEQPENGVCHCSLDTSPHWQKWIHGTQLPAEIRRVSQRNTFCKMMRQPGALYSL